MEGEVLQNFSESKFHIHESKPHANAVPGSISKGQIYIRINAALVLLAEPGDTINDSLTEDESIRGTHVKLPFDI